jgi:hypothetical protein
MSRQRKRMSDTASELLRASSSGLPFGRELQYLFLQAGLRPPYSVAVGQDALRHVAMTFTGVLAGPVHVCAFRNVNATIGLAYGAQECVWGVYSPARPCIFTATEWVAVAPLVYFAAVQVVLPDAPGTILMWNAEATGSTRAARATVRLCEALTNLRPGTAARPAFPWPRRPGPALLCPVTLVREVCIAARTGVTLRSPVPWLPRGDFGRVLLEAVSRHVQPRVQLVLLWVLVAADAPRLKHAKLKCKVAQAVLLLAKDRVAPSLVGGADVWGPARQAWATDAPRQNKRPRQLYVPV